MVSREDPWKWEQVTSPSSGWVDWRRRSSLATMLTVLLVMALYLPSAFGQQIFEPGKGKPATAFRLRDTAGKRHQLTHYRGKLLLLNFWATWCGPCREEMPVLSRAAREWASKDVVILGVAMDAEGWKKVTPFLQQNPVDYPILLGTPQVARDYGVGRVYPATVVIGPDGVILGTITTALDEAQLSEVLEKMTAKMALR